MTPYYLEHDEAEESYTVRGPDGFEWWIEDGIDVMDLNIHIVVAELNMLYFLVGGNDDGTV